MCREAWRMFRKFLCPSKPCELDLGTFTLLFREVSHDPAKVCPVRFRDIVFHELVFESFRQLVEPFTVEDIVQALKNVRQTMTGSHPSTAPRARGGGQSLSAPPTVFSTTGKSAPRKVTNVMDSSGSARR